MKGKIIVIEGTDCSGKATQTKLLKENLEKLGYKVFQMSYPCYDTPTGKIIGGPYLGKESICDGWFPETAPYVEPKVGILYYAADRFYNLPKLLEKQKEGYVILLDRYTYSNMAHQGGKLSDSKKRKEMYEWISKLEFEMLGLPEPEIKLFLHMNSEGEKLLKQNRVEEKSDEHERNETHIKNAETAYFEISEKYRFTIFECHKKLPIQNLNDIKTPEEISKEILDCVLEKLKN